LLARPTSFPIPRGARGTVAGLAAITLLGLALRLHGAFDTELSYDEGATWYFAGLPLADLWGAPARLETNPPLFYTLAHALRTLGAGAEDERLLAVVSGSACIPLAFLLAGRLGGRFAGFAAALLVASSAAQIGMSQDARAYAALTAAALAALLAVQALLAGAGLSAFCCYALAALAALYLHNTAVLLVAACNGIVVLVALDPARRPPGLFWRWTVANAVVLAGWAPWAGLVLDQARHALEHFWLARPTLTEFRYDLQNTFALRFLTIGEPFADAAFLGMLGLGVLAVRRAPFGRALAFCVLAGVPVTSFAISQWRPILNGKTLLWLIPVGLCFVALGCDALRRGRFVALALAVALQLTATAQFFRARVPEGYAAAAALLRDQAAAADAMVVAPRFLAFMLEYHGRPPGSFQTFSLGEAAPWFPAEAAPPLAPDAALAALRAFPRVWLATRGQDALARALAARLDCAFTRADASAGPALRLVRFDRRAASTCG
jgi:4-amino-4-deoxy-L-arabinose transferase-like glycosyltransferase